MKKVLKIEDMTCVNCAKVIEKHISKVEGVENIKVSFTLKQAEIEFNEFLVSEEEITREIEKLGYRVKKDLKSRIREEYILVFCIIASAYFIADMFLPIPASPYIQLLLSTFVQIIGGYGFYLKAFKALKESVGNMEVLVSVGTTGAYIYSILAFLHIIEGTPFFETPVFIITFVKLGKFIEEKIKNRALKDLFSIAHLTVEDFKVIRDGKEEYVNINNIKKGDILELRGGNLCPVDGVIVEGDAYINESIVTGEGIPVHKSKGDKVISGSILEGGKILISVDKPFKESYAFQLSKAVASTFSKKPKIQRLVDKVSTYFVEGVILFSFFTFIFWFLVSGDIYKSIQFALSILVVSCPCALGIATPLAITSGVSRALKKGIIIRDTSVFEKMPFVDIFIFDKTGTLTEGKMSVEKVDVFDEKGLGIALSMESTSNHPIAKAIYEFCKERVKDAPTLRNCQEIKGFGVKCGEYIATSVSKWGIENKDGYITVGVGTEEKPFVVFYLKDKIRKEAKEVISFIKGRGIKTVLLTGDSRKQAMRVGKALEIDEIYADSKPEDKLRIVELFQDRGYKVAMVGDGINDALALAKADVSIAVAEGADIAKRAGDVILLEGIKTIPYLIAHSDKTYARIKQNLMWAFVYNVFAIPLAGGFLSWAGLVIKPEIAGMMMALSSLSVVINSIRK